MYSKREVLCALVGLILLASPAYAANDKRQQPGASRPLAPAVHPAPVFHPAPAIAARPPSPVGRAALPAISPPRHAPAPVFHPAPVVAARPPAPLRQPARTFQPPRPVVHSIPQPPSGLASAAPIHRVTPAQPSAPRLVEAAPAHHFAPPPQPGRGLAKTTPVRGAAAPIPVSATHRILPPVPQRITYDPPSPPRGYRRVPPARPGIAYDPPLNPIHKVPQPGWTCDGDGDNCRPAPQTVCDADGDRCQQVWCDADGDNCQAASPPPQPVVCDGDGDNCRQLPYWSPQYGFPTYYYQPNNYPVYYNYQEPEDEEDENFNAYYLPYEAPPVVCDEDGDDCGPAPYFNEAYQPWMPLPPMPVPYTLQPAYYADPDLMRVRTRLIGMDQQARIRYQSAVANHQRRQAAHFFHATRSLDGQLTRLDARLRTGAEAGGGYASAIR